LSKPEGLLSFRVPSAIMWHCKSYTIDKLKGAMEAIELTRIGQYIRTEGEELIQSQK
jgi:hypothetical protein